MALQDDLQAKLLAVLRDPTKNQAFRYLDATQDPVSVSALMEQEVRQAILTHVPEVRLRSIVATVSNGRINYSVSLLPRIKAVLYDGTYKYNGAIKYSPTITLNN